MLQQGNTSPQVGRGFGAGRSLRPPRVGFGSTGFGDSYGSSGFESGNDDIGGRRSEDESGFASFPRGFRDRRATEETYVFTRGFGGSPIRTEEDWNNSGDFRGGPESTEGNWNVSRGFPRGFRGSSLRSFGGSSEEDWNCSGGNARNGRNNGSFGWQNENSRGANWGGASGGGKGGWQNEDKDRNFISYTRGSLFGRQEGAYVGGRRLSGGVQKRGKFPTAEAARKGFKNFRRDPNYEFLKRYVDRIDKTIKRGRKGIIAAPSSSSGKKLLNDFVYCLAQAEQEMRARLSAARENGGCTGKCNFCGRTNSENQQISHGNATNVKVNAVANININEEEEEW